MMSIYYILTFLGVLFLGLSKGDDVQKLYLAGLFPLSKEAGDIGLGVLPAVQMAIEQVNANRTLLPGYELEVIVEDTQCDMAVGTKLLFDMFHKSPPVMLFGGACPQVTGPLAQTTVPWEMAQLSYADTDPGLSERDRYPYFFRTVPSDIDLYPAVLALLKHYNWTRVGTIYQDSSKGYSRYAVVHDNHLTKQLRDDNITILAVENNGFADDPSVAVQNLKARDVRIILGLFSAEMARRVFCNAFHEGLYGPKIVWFLQGGYPTHWWKVNDSSIDCTPMQLEKALEGHFTTDVHPITTRFTSTDTGMSTTEYTAEYNKRRKKNYSKFHGYAYDGIWTIAKALHAMVSTPDSRTKRSASEEIAQLFWTPELRSSLNNTHFQGVTGVVRFNKGERLGEIEHRQFQGGDMYKVGEYYLDSEVLDLHKGEPVMWHGKGPPMDRTLSTEEAKRVNLLAYAILCVLAGIGVNAAAIFLLLNIYYRKHRYIKMSSPNMNNIIMVGCIMTYASVFLLGTDGGLVSPHIYPYLCTARAWVLSIGFTFAFGAMFAKTWRVHAIFTNIKLQKKVIKDYKLIMIVGVLLGLDLVILCTWSFVDPLRRSTKRLDPRVDATGDREVIPIMEYCVSDHMTIWLAAIYAYKGLLLVFGCFLAWETRHVSIPALNDSKYIGMSVYNVVIMCVSGAAISFIINDQQDAAFIILSLFIIFCTTITLCLVFVPKLLELRKDPKGDKKRIHVTIKKPKVPTDIGYTDVQQKIKDLTDENARNRQILEYKHREIESLLIQLGEDVHASNGGIPRSPGLKPMVLLKQPNSHFLIPPGRRPSQDTLNSDEASVFSESLNSVVWPLDGSGNSRSYFVAQRDALSCSDSVELTDLESSKRSFQIMPTIESETSVERESSEDHKKVEFTVHPCIHNNYGALEEGLHTEETSLNKQEVPKTPSYSGLKYLKDVWLRETDILSDSDPSVSELEHDDVADLNTNLL
ncbi:unnamed protein product [Owenia fusiformis]|uniref:Gamma-aminobutyric acid type B receptor subunit 2 n=1 Tax=Owenia fusiformis TaxID=6347 RepID=A0A8S4NY43_OWEFU|nr:unnamed protein product [Owenia fusiformis]